MEKFSSEIDLENLNETLAEGHKTCYARNQESALDYVRMSEHVLWMWTDKDGIIDVSEHKM